MIWVFTVFINIVVSFIVYRTHFYQKEESSWGHIRVSLVLILQAFVLETEGRARGCCAVCLVAF